MSKKWNPKLLLLGILGCVVGAIVFFWKLPKRMRNKTIEIIREITPFILKFIQKKE